MGASVATFDDTMIDIIYELDDREIYNDIRSETIVESEEEIDDSHWEEGTITTTRGTSYYASDTAKEHMSLLGLPSDVTREDVISVTWSGELHHKGGSGWTITDCNLSVRLHDTLKRCYVMVPVDTGPSGYPDLYNGDLHITYNGEEWAEESHLETVYTTISVHAEDVLSMAKYGRRSMNLIWPAGANEVQSQSIVDSYCTRYSEPVARCLVTLIGKNDTLRLQMLIRTMSDKITLISSHLGLSTDFWINKVDYQDFPDRLPQVVWVVEQVRAEEEAGVFTIDTSFIDGDALIG